VSELPEIDALLDERARDDRERDALRYRVDRLRAAARWEAHRVVTRTREKVRDASDRAKALAGFRSDDLGAWRDAVAALREAAALSKNAEFNASVLVEQEAIDAARLRESEDAVDRLEQLREEYRRRGLPAMVEEARRGERAARAWSRARGPAAILATLLLASGVALASRSAGAAGLPSRMRLAMAAGAAGTAGLVAAGIALAGAVRARAHAARIRRTVEACGEVLLDVSDLDSCAAHLDAIGEEIAEADSVLAAARARRDATRGRLAAARETAVHQSAEVDRAQVAVAAVRARAGVASPDELEARLRERSEAEAAAVEARRMLDSLSAARTSDPGGEGAAPTSPDPGIPANPAALASAEARLRELEDASLRLREAIAERRDRVLASLGLADVSGLETERERLSEQAERIEREERAARLCLESLGELSFDLDEPLRESLGDGPEGAGATLAGLTGGRWVRVLPGDDGRLLVEASDGSRLPAAALSRGARDQVALAVRLALVRRLVGEPAFLVLDDAFLTSDAARRDALAAAVAELSREGWQIVFFTFDDAIRDAFADLGARVVELERFPRRPVPTA
ncbi:MAG: ATP-binding protein, partial [Alphaproteobacteria bacterium]